MVREDCCNRMRMSCIHAGQVGEVTKPVFRSNVYFSSWYIPK